MHVNCDQSLKLDALDLGQIGGRDGDQRVENVQEVLIGVLHDLFVEFGVVQRFFRLLGPNHLNTKQTDLYETNCKCKDNKKKSSFKV